MTKTLKWLSISLLLSSGVTAIWAEETGEPETDKKRERYLTPEDKRDASLGREVVDGVVVSWLVETESQRVREDYGDSERTLDTETVYTVQLAIEVELSEWAAIELVGESEKELRWQSQLEEGILALEWGDWSADVGRFNVPFGEYYSQFISDVTLEAGETRGDSVAIDYNWGDNVEISAYSVRHDDKRVKQDKQDWGLGLVYQVQQFDAQFTVAYLSAIVDDDDDILEIYGSEKKLHHAWTASVLLSLENWLLTAEALRAQRRGVDLPTSLENFGGLNLELGFYGLDSFRFSVRRQENRGVLSSPINQVGWGINWVSNYNFSLTFEQMWNDYASHEELDVIKDREINFGVVIEF